MTDRRVDVFVSYRHRSAHAAWVRSALVPALEVGYTVLIDVRDFTPGGVLVEEMEGASARARVTVAVIDETYADGGFVEFERHLAGRLIAVRRDAVDPLIAAEAAITVDAIGKDDPAPVVDAVHRLVRRVFILEAPEEKEWVDGVLLPTLDRTGASAEDYGALVAGENSTDAVLDRLVRSDRVVIVLSRAYLREVHPRTGRLVAQVEAKEHQDKTLPVQRETNIDLPPALENRVIIDASRAELWDKALGDLCRALEIELPPPDRAPPCPYPGMRPFSEGERDQFFGRNHEIDDVLSGLRRRRFVAIIGPSASGKSSLALAGVGPRLEARGLDGGEPWQVETVRPGTRPADALGGALGRWRGTAGRRRELLVIVDQLEELFAPDTEGADEFEASLQRLVEDEPLVHVLVTLRADFYPNVMSGALWPLISASRVEVVPLSGSALREAIREPARSRGVVVAEALVERLAAETEGQPGLLPFLQETLVTLWSDLRYRLITLDAYERIGDGAGSGVLQSIRRVAEGAVGEISATHPDGEQIVRSILLRLVQFGEGRPHTRRRLPVDALRSAAPDDITFQSVFDTLVERRLLTVEGDPGSTQYADLSHEAIIRGWPELARWIDERRVTEATRRHLLDEAHEWEERSAQGHPEVGLLESLDLADAQRWLKSPDAADLGVDPSIEHFVTASADRSSRRRRRRLLTAAAAFAALLLVAAVLAVSTVKARQAQHDAERASQERLALQLRAASAEFGDERLPLRALLVQAADKLDPSQLSLVEMLTTVERERLIAARIDPPTTQAGFDAMWVDSDLVVVGAGDGMVYAWPMAGDTPDLATAPRTFKLAHTPLAMARRPGSDLLAIGGGDGSPEQGTFPGSNGGVDLVDLGAPTLTPHPLGLSGDSPVSTLAFLGDRLLVGRWDGTITFVNLQQPDAPVVERSLRMPAAPSGARPVCSQRDKSGDQKVRTLAVDESGRWLAAGANNCVIAIWDLEAPASSPQVLADHNDKVRALAFVPGTTTLLSTGDDRSIRQWEVGPATGASTLLAAAADQQRVIALCIAPDGKSVVTAGRDHLVRRWELDGSALTPDPTALAGHGQTIRAVTCTSPTRFASLGADGLVMWDLDRPSRVGRQVALAGLSSLEAVAVRPGTTEDVAAAATDQSSGSGAVVVDRPNGDQRTIDLGTTFPLALAYSTDGRYLAVAGDTPAQAGWAAVYDATSLNKVADGPAQPLSTLRAVAVVDAEHWAVGSDEGIIEVHDGGEVRQGRVESGFGIHALAFAPDGRLLVGDDTGYLSCYDPRQMDHRLGRRLLGRTIPSIAFGGDGTVVAGTFDGFVGVFPAAFRGGTSGAGCDPQSWVRVDLTVASDAVDSVALAADGQLLVVGTNDGTTELWDVQRRRRIGTLALDREGARTSAGVDPTGSVIAAGTGRGVEVYSLDRSSLRGRLCELAGRQLTPDERTAFLPQHNQQGAGRCDAAAPS